MRVATPHVSRLVPHDFVAHLLVDSRHRQLSREAVAEIMRVRIGDRRSGLNDPQCRIRSSRFPCDRLPNFSTPLRRQPLPSGQRGAFAPYLGFVDLCRT